LRRATVAVYHPAVTSRSLLAALAVASACAAGAVSLPAHADEAPTRQYIVDDRLPPRSAQWKLALGGLGATAAFYALAQPFSYVWPDAQGSRELRIPVAGPWMSLARDTCPESEPDCSTLWLVFRGLLTTLDGIGQVGGVAVAFEGLFLQTSASAEKEPARPAVPSRPKRERPWTPPESSPPGGPGAPPRPLFFMPTPMTVGQRGVGLGVVGVF
jgi:hypothetical protein